MRWRLGHTPEAHVAALPAGCAEVVTESGPGTGLGATAGATAVISREDFSLLGRGPIRRLRALFPGEGVRILVYLRHQDLWLYSLYGQMLKVGRYQNVGAFIARDRHRMDYAGFPALWAEVFGAENRIVRVYEGFETGGLCTDFCIAVGVPEAAASVYERSRNNVSLSREASTFLSLIRNERWRYLFRSALKGGQPVRPRSRLSYLSPRQARHIIDEKRAANARLAATHLGRAQLFCDESPLAARTRPPRPVRRALVLWQLVAGLVLRILDRLRAG